MSAEVTELRNPRAPNRSFRIIRKVRVPMAKWVQERKVTKGPGMSTSSYIPLVFLISSVIGLFQVEKALKAHPANMWISVAALVIFCFSRATKKKITQSTRWARCSPIVDALRVLSGTLVAVSLISIFLPDPIWWLFFVIWVSLAFVVIYSGVMKAFQIHRTYHSAARCFA